MRTVANVPTLVLSLDVAETVGEATLGQQFMRMISARRMPATWAMPEVTKTALTQRIVNDPAGHDLALLADASWAGPQAGRTRFSRELARRVVAARALGAAVNAIALQGVELQDNLDLLVKHRISIIRGPAEAAKPAADLRPQSVRFGVWNAPVAAVAPQTGWQPFWGKWNLRQAARWAIKHGAAVQVVIQAERLANPTSDLRELDLALAHLQRQRDKGQIQLMTLSSLGERLNRQPQMRPARSVLRAA